MLQSCYDMVMKFITMRELRNQTSQILEGLNEETGVVTSNGEPVGILLRVGEGDFEETLAVLRQARAAAAVSKLRETARSAGTDRLSNSEIDQEIRAARAERTS